MFETTETVALREAIFNSPAREFPTAALEFLYGRQLFKIFVPMELGGGQVALPEAARLLEHCAYLDGDLGWAAQIGAGGGFFSAFVSHRLAQKYFTDPNFVIAGSGMPTGNLERGKVNGSWRYCSGSNYASLFTFTVKDGSSIKAVAVDPAQVKIVEDWDAYGMSHTQSHTVEVTDIGIEGWQQFSFEKVDNDYGYSLYYLPFKAFARVCISSVLIGCFEHLCEEAEEILKQGSSNELRSKKLAASLKKIKSENSRWYQEYRNELNKLWEQTEVGKPAPSSIEGGFNQKVAGYNSFLKNAAYQLFNLCGMRASSRSQPFNKVWRDFTTAAQHVFA